MREIWRIIRYSKALWRYYAAVGFFVIIISVLNLANPFLSKEIVDTLVDNLTNDSFQLGYLAILVGLTLLVDMSATVLNNINGYIGDRLAVKLNTLLSQRYYDHLLELPIEYFDNEITGRITSRLDRSISTISQLMNILANNFVQFALTTVVTLIAMTFYSWEVSLLLFFLFPIYIILTHKSSESWSKKQEAINKDIDYSQGRFLEAISQIRVVKSFVQEAVESRIFSKRRQDIDNRTKDQSRQWHKYDVARQVVLNVIFFSILAYIVYKTYLRALTIGEMVLLVQLSNQAKYPLFGSSFIIDHIQRARAGSKDFFEVMETKPSIKDKPGAKYLQVQHGKVEFQKVGFSYKGGKEVLKDISFTVEPGTKLAIIGESGEGKSTIANLLLRFYEPSSGRILIDGEDISEVAQSSLRRNIGVVFQDPVLFSGTVAENITYGSPKANYAKMEAVAKAANAHNFISKLSKGYQTQVGERGVKLSGGQKQRIAIARALMEDSPILILDEATSSLDSKAELAVQEAIEFLMKDRTSLVIAHRLSTISNVDMIIAIKDGKVAEFGSPKELAATGGIYAELLALQHRADSEKLKQYEIAGV